MKNYWSAPRLLATGRGSLSQILASLKYKNFRLYFGGQFISVLGTWIQQIAMGWLAYKLTGSVWILATVAFMEQVPILFATPFMSILTDRFDRHKLLIGTQTAAMIQAMIMTVLVYTDQVALWNLMALSLFAGFINALDMPTRQAFYIELVPKESLGNAIALNASVINACRLIGPAVGGILIHWVGEGACFFINALSYSGVIVALMMMKLSPPPINRTRINVRQDLYEGFRYVKGDFSIRTLLITLSLISFFGFPFNIFVPAFANTTLNGNSELLGWLLSFIGVGSFIAAIYLASRKSVFGLGSAIQYAVFGFGITVFAISFVRTAWLATLLCIPIGFCIIIIGASVNTLLQTLTEERMRGRVMGYLAVAFSGITALGGLVFGAIEQWVGLTEMFAMLGISTIFVAMLFTRVLPELRRQAYPVFANKEKVTEVTFEVQARE